MVAAFEKEKVERIKKQWKLLWLEKLDDKLKAEGMATRIIAHYSLKKEQ